MDVKNYGLDFLDASTENPVDAGMAIICIDLTVDGVVLV